MAVYNLKFKTSDILSGMSSSDLMVQFEYWRDLFDRYTDDLENDNYSNLDSYKMRDISNFFRSIESVE